MNKFEQLSAIMNKFSVAVEPVIRNNDGLKIVLVWEETKTGGKRCRWQGFDTFEELVDDLINHYYGNENETT